MLFWLFFIALFAIAGALVAHFRGAPALFGALLGAVLGPIGIFIAFLLPLELTRFENSDDPTE